MSDDGIPQSDQLEGAPHPRDTPVLYGHSSAEREFLDLHATGQLHHAWLISGPRGIGKATLAWRIARFLIADKGNAGADIFGEPAPSTLQMDPDNPVFRRVAALAEPGIALCRRSYDVKAKRLKAALSVDEVRKLKSFFNLSAAEGGWRVAIVDAADEMNISAANALLKLLEEPPERTILLLVCHRPARLLPTIRSRCRVLRLNALSPDDLSSALTPIGVDINDDPLLAVLANGSVGEAIRLQNGGGCNIYRNILRLLNDAPQMDRGGIIALADIAAKRGAEAEYDLIVRLVGIALSRLARAGATSQTDGYDDAEINVAQRLGNSIFAAQEWATCLQNIEARSSHARAVNIDPGQVILDMFLKIEQTAGRIANQPAP